MSIIDQIETVLELPHTPQKVWRAITTSEGLSQWFGDRVTMALTEGSAIHFEWDAYGSVGGEIETVQPMSKFSYRWRAHGVSENEPMTEANSTLVTFELTPTASGTKLRVLETGFATLHPDYRERAFRENQSGWATELAELVDYLEQLPQ